MCSNVLACAEKDLSYFFWRAEVHRLSQTEVDQGWRQLKSRLLYQCPKKLDECQQLNEMFAAYRSRYLKLLSVAEPHVTTGLVDGVDPVDP